MGNMPTSRSPVVHKPANQRTMIASISIIEQALSPYLKNPVGTVPKAYPSEFLDKLKNRMVLAA